MILFISFVDDAIDCKLGSFMLEGFARDPSSNEIILSYSEEIVCKYVRYDVQLVSSQIPVSENMYPGESFASRCRRRRSGCSGAMRAAAAV